MGISPNAGTQTVHSAYRFANEGREAPARFTSLSALYDPGTIRRLEERGVTQGWHCLEIGGGSGTIAKWLADRVAPAGRVLSTDIDTRYLDIVSGPNLEVRRHDIGSDPLPEAAFDLIHTRLVLMHVVEREAALTRMISSLKPGGWLVMEEYDSYSMPPDPAVNPGETSLKTHSAMLRLLEANGVNRRYGRLLPGLLRSGGLTGIGAEAQIYMWQHGSPGISMMRANFEQLREAMIQNNYISRELYDEDLGRLNDPNFMMPSSILWSAWGQRS